MFGRARSGESSRLEDAGQASTERALGGSLRSSSRVPAVTVPRSSSARSQPIPRSSEHTFGPSNWTWMRRAMVREGWSEPKANVRSRANRCSTPLVGNRRSLAGVSTVLANVCSCEQVFDRPWDGGASPLPGPPATGSSQGCLEPPTSYIGIPPPSRLGSPPRAAPDESRPETQENPRERRRMDRIRPRLGLSQRR